MVWIAGWRACAWPRRRAQWLHLAVTGVLMHAGYLGGVWAAVKLGMGVGPVGAARRPAAGADGAVARPPRGSQIRDARQWVGLVLGLAGLVLVVWRKLGTGGEVNWLNLSLALVRAVRASRSARCTRSASSTPCDVRTANAVQLAAALLVTLPLALLEPEAIRLAR